MTGPSRSARPYRGEDDLAAMLDLLMEGRARTNDWRYPHVGELLFNYFMIDRHLGPRDHIRLWHDEGRLVGFATLGEDPSIDWHVLPEHEWSGIEADALDWAEARLVELRHENRKVWGGELVSGSRKSDKKRTAFLKRRGFHFGGVFAEVNMEGSLTGRIGAAEVPPGYEIRSLREGELERRAAAHREVWRPWPVGDMSAEGYRRFTRLPGYRRDLDVVAVSRRGVIASYANCWIDPVNKIGDLGPVGALPRHRRRGLTRAVLLEGLRRMRALGMDRVCVSAQCSNQAARDLYESVGFRVVNEYLDYAKQV